MTLVEAIKKVQDALKDESYRNTWTANLAMSTYDELPQEMSFELKREIANRAAERFLNLLENEGTK